MPESLFASDYSPVSPATTNSDQSPPSIDSRLSRTAPLRQSKFAPNGEYVDKHDVISDSIVDKVTGLPTPPRSPPTQAQLNAPPLERDQSEESGNTSSSGSGRGSGRGSGSGSGSANGTIKSARGGYSNSNSSKSSATLLELTVDPLDKPYVPGASRRKHADYNTYEGCMEGECSPLYLHVQMELVEHDANTS